ncbi:MAG: glycosyltransferase family 4 protein [Roseiflexus sp.]|nr:glycosyltransferase family 4 protein [Roseiflexus sp.]MCS7290050.1 glycosyltransferase family 4 protein [Roseiflexus sp.]MDW8148489.1 glycosyltransferase family 4 protein [Roseiflexaceae bacterium]MDW8232153.1 glycosyltransferase family 4 protein [Roseiflexaceae bacterium]
MNILMLTSSYPKYVGETTAPFIESIAVALARRQHTVHVVAPYHPDVRRAPIEHGVRLHFYRYAPHRALNVYGYAESLRADVGLRQAALAAAPFALAASLRALLHLTRRYQFDLIHAHWVLPNGAPALIAARLRRLPLVVSLHGSDVYLAYKGWILALSAAAVFRSAGAITACSRDLCQRAVRLGAPPERTIIIPYGVDAHAFRPDPRAGVQVRAELNLPPDTPLILAMGRMVYKKGFTYLLDAMPHIRALHPRATLVLAGYGDLYDELKERARRLGVEEAVILPGRLPRDRAAHYVAAADVYVVPSVRDDAGNVDGLPNTLLEGMGAARPIVATCTAGIPDIMADGVHGLLVPERNPAALADAIARLLDNRDLAARLGEAARRRVLEELSWDATAARFEEAYRRATM